MADRIELKGLRCPGFHGVFAFERREGQEFIVDITCWLDCRPAAQSDEVADTVHYGELAQLAYDIVTGPPRDLIETVAAEIADRALLQWPILHAIEVKVHKPAAPIPLNFSDVAVVARRSRKNAGL